jgi:chromosome segregation ATPase
MSGYCLESGSNRWRLGSRIAAAIIVAHCYTSSLNAADDPVKIRLAALVEEGDILSLEAANLVPETKRVKLEGDKVIASERTLLDQSDAIKKAFEQYNTDVTKHGEAVKDWRDRCRTASSDADAKQACDAEAAELSAQAAKLEERLPALQARRDALNVRIDQHNAARLKWDERKRKQDARVDVNEREIQGWIDRARAFWATEGFSLLVKQTGNPTACARLQQTGLGDQRPVEASKGIQQCFKAVKAG